MICVGLVKVIIIINIRLIGIIYLFVWGFNFGLVFCEIVVIGKLNFIFVKYV